MEKYLGEIGSSYSRKTMQLLTPLYVLFFLAALSLLLQAFAEISSGRNLSGEYAPLGAADYLALVFAIVLAGAMFYVLWYLRTNRRCGDLAPRLARFMAMSTNEYVPIRVIAEILRVKPEETVPLLRSMLKRKYIRNLEITPDGGQIRILQYHRIYVFEVYCKNCGATYTQTSEDDYICQYCEHPVVRITPNGR
ncbi:MAG: hypothetical protein IJG52_07520 [Lachnospiraceae bacterium]|nr:hypothetical protein [Lachnospiraceae bacterium]